MHQLNTCRHAEVCHKMFGINKIQLMQRRHHQPEKDKKHERFFTIQGRYVRLALVKIYRP